MELIITLFLLLILTLLLFTLLCYLFDNLFGGEDYTTNKISAQRVAEEIYAQHYEHGVLYDLGSGRGGFVLDIAGRCPNLQAVGIDNSLIRTWTAKLRNLIKNNDRVTFIKGDIFTADVSKADVVYAYLPRPMLPALAEKLKKELKPGAVAITSRVYFTNWKPVKIISKNISNKYEEDVFIYKNLTSKDRPC